MTRVKYGPPSVEKTLGSLPVVKTYLRRLDVAGTVDRLCPVGDGAHLTHGQVVEVLVANRLTSPTPMVRVADWARAFAVAEVFGVDPDDLNDDRIARALDAIAPRLAEVTGSVGARAVTSFGLDTSRVHWDMTSISLFGDYPDADDDYAAPAYGHPKDRRVDLKQVQTGIAVTGDGGIPVHHRAYDGNDGEVNQVVGAMRALKKIARPPGFLLVGDSKLVSHDNLAALDAAKVRYIAPASKTYVGAATLAALDREAATPVDYTARRDASRPADRRAAYRVREGTTTITGRRKADPPLHVRTVFVWNSARAAAAATARAKKLDRAREDLDRLARAAGTHHYPDRKAVETRLDAIARTRKVRAHLRATTGTDPDTGTPTLAWHFDQAALDAEAATDGWYALLTNLTPAEADAAEVLPRYKGQEVVERRYHAFKGPLAVAPLFLELNRRIQALVTVICLALLVFCLVERAVRTAIAPDTTLDGLYNHRPARPTGTLVFRTLAGLRLIPGDPAVIPRPTPLQQRLLDLLGVDPTHPP